MSNHLAGLKPIIIINADDFGLTDRDNAAILTSFEQSVITSATLMANMPVFAQACQLAKEQQVDKHLGLHFNLTYGKPLSADIRLISNICNVNGEFDFSIARHTIFLPKATRQAIYTELECQWQACIDNGIEPSHIDSHQHVHNLLPIAKIVAKFAQQKGVSVRLARNLGKNISTVKAIFKSVLNSLITRHTQTPVRYACTPQDLLDGLNPSDGVIEIISHPRKLADGRIGDDYLPDDVALQDVIDAAYPGAQKVSYNYFKR